MHWFHRLALLALMALGTLLPACGGGDARLGEPCESDDDCARGLCVGGVNGDRPACTRSCAGNEDCPHGWSCSGVTQNQVLVCSHGAATPFGDGNGGH